MRISTALNHVQRFKSILCEEELNQRLEHLQILENLRRRIYSTPEYTKLPGWAKSELSGFREGLSTMIRRTGMLVWCTGEWEGVRYLTWDSLPEEAKDRLRRKEPGAEAYSVGVEQYHFWRDTGVRFSPRGGYPKVAP